MGQLWDTLVADVDKIVRVDKWKVSDGIVVPSPENIGLGNEGVRLDAVVLYADLVDSTRLVTNYKDTFAAEVYKCFLSCACKIIKNLGGTIVGFDGDRVMAIYVGSNKNTCALKTALRINGAVHMIINPMIKNEWNTDYTLHQVVGVDSGKLLVAKTGVRGDNDLVWVGPAANYAAKLCNLRIQNYASWCTKAVYEAAHNEAKYFEGKPMWEARSWTVEGDQIIYRSDWVVSGF